VNLRVPTTTARKCWCGNDRLDDFSPGYFKCARCETLVAREMPKPQDVTNVGADESGFYGKEYWFSHQENDIGIPNLAERARADLPERCVHWLRTLLKYKLPPGKTLELGAAHGGFVALLSLAGFDSTGLELSPWIAQFARDTFGVKMLQGPVEGQSIQPASLDALILMDVIEHLADPVATLKYCVGLVKEDGMIIVQTPNLPQGKSFQEMGSERDYFLNHLRPDEHLHLFSNNSVRALFERIGRASVEFEPAIFAQYDQFFVASRGNLTENSPEQIKGALNATPGGRIAGALLDLAENRDYFANECAARLKVIEQLDAEVKRLSLAR
jgi:SAM-dependent methyltransferase